VLTTSFYGYDGHGSVRQLTNTSGAVTDTYDYDAFGNLINSTGSTPNNYLFAGEQYDPALGLYYNRARYLNTTTGRFWSMDTDEGSDGDPLSLHKYLYADADPIDGADPAGLQDSMGELGAEESLSAGLDSMPTLNIHTTLASVKPETLYIRAFAPWKTFGFGFAGDNRSFTTSRDSGVTSRVNGIVQFYLPSFELFSYYAYSDPSHYGNHAAIGNPTIEPTISGNKMHVDVAGNNPLVPSADIDIHLDLSVRDTSGQACYSGQLSGDAFPDVEVFVVNRENVATMLEQFATGGPRQLGPYLYLPGDSNRPMGNFSNKCTAE
jgi:RHS repeat-associated protein